MSALGPQHDVDALERQALYWRGLLDDAGHGPIEARMNAEAVERRLRRALARLDLADDASAPRARPQPRTRTPTNGHHHRAACTPCRL